MVRSAPLPEGLAARVAGALDDEDRGAPSAVGTRSLARRLLWPMAASAALAIAASLWLLSRSDLPGLVADDYVRYRTGSLALEIESASADEIQAYFEARAAFPPRVFDLGMMGCTLVGGRIDEMAGDDSALFVYRGPAGQIVICQMFPGVTNALPPTGDV